VAMLTGLVMGLVVFFGANGIASTWLRAPHLAPALRIASTALLFNVLNWFLMGALAGLAAYRLLGLSGVASGGASLALGAAGVWAGGLRGALAGVAVSAAFQTLVLAACYRNEARRQGLPGRPGGLKTERDVIWRFALPGAIPGFTTLPSYWLACL